MADLPTVSGGQPSNVDGPRVDASPEASPAVSTSTAHAGECGGTLPLLEETLTVSKRRRSTGRVRIATRTETTETTVEVELERCRVEVTRVPVGRVVDEVPTLREEGDTTVVPVVEERFVVVKQLVLVEELRIRHVRERETVSEPVTLRRQRAVVQRFDHNGEPVALDEPTSE